MSAQVGMREIAAMLGVSRQRAYRIAAEYGDFPPPVASLRMGRVWDIEAVGTWADRHRDRGPGRPRRAPDRPAREGVGAQDELVGREGEVCELLALLPGRRLLTLTGPPGVGKTALSRRLVAEAAGLYDGGVWTVELASTMDPALVGAAVAQAMQVREHPGRRPVAAVASHLSSRRALVVLDNCEHLLVGCAELVSQLVASCPGVTVLATSQEPLGLDIEQVWVVLPLPVPAAGDRDVASLERSASVRLFCARAGAARAGFVLTADCAPAVADICRRLEGIPLALELAAARVGVLAPAEIAARLDGGLALLSRPQAVPQKQAGYRFDALRGALDWSHGLLPPYERRVLRRLSVFGGGAGLDAVESVCGDGADGGTVVVDALSALVARSLVTADTRGPRARYSVLETVRAYGRERLAEAGETRSVRDRHLEWCISLAERAESELTGRHQADWLDRLSGEHDNLMAALGWSIQRRAGGEALRLAAALTLYWRLRGNFQEGREWLGRALALGQGHPRALVARAVWGAGFLSMMLAQDDAGELLERSLALSRQEGDRRVEARSLLLLGNLRQSGDLGAARCAYDASAALARQDGDDWCLAHALGLWGQAHSLRGDAAAALPLLEDCLRVAGRSREPQSLRLANSLLGELALLQWDHVRAGRLLGESLAIGRALGEPFAVAIALGRLADLDLQRGRVNRARASLEEALAIARGEAVPSLLASTLCSRGRLEEWTGDVMGAAETYDEAVAVLAADDLRSSAAHCGLGRAAVRLGDARRGRLHLDQALAIALESQDLRALADARFGLGRAASASGELREASRLHHQALALRHRMGEIAGVVESLEAVAGLSLVFRQHRLAVRLLAAAQAMRQRSQLPRPPGDRRDHRAVLAQARRAAGDEFGNLSLQGAALSAAGAVALAERGRGPRRRAASGWAGLTNAERDVALLVATGLTNSQIAERLFVAPRTVGNHLSRIFAKLDLGSRTQLAAEVFARTGQTG